MYKELYKELNRNALHEILAKDIALLTQAVCKGY